MTKLNRGGMADVYLAQEIGTDDPEHWLAIKTLLPRLYDQSRYIDMFTSEGELGMMLQHPNIARTYSVEQAERRDGRVPLLVMQYVHGRDLGAVARNFRRDNIRMPIPQALYIMQEVLKGLSYAHNLRDSSGTLLHLVNRDISPPNIMIGFDGDVRLIDFGIAQATLDFHSQIGAIKGKISYMSPEQVRGLPVDARSDLFSLTVVLYQLITGVEPFAGDSDIEQMERVRRADVVKPSNFNTNISPELDAFIMHGLARDADVRFDSADAMLEALAPIRETQPVPYGAEELSSFMAAAFESDLQLLRSRIGKARRIMRQLIHSGASLWSAEMGERAVAAMLPGVVSLLNQTPILGGEPVPDAPPSTTVRAVPKPEPEQPEPIFQRQEEIPAADVDLPPTAPSDAAQAPSAAPAHTESHAGSKDSKPPAWALPTLAVL
ncbi:MAG: serine/threonine-protein kinase, partial [Myxococcota bacterium]